MSCQRFARDVVADDTAERRRARRHAATCDDCARRLAGHLELIDRVEAWRAATPGPPPRLESRVLAAAAAAEARRLGPLPGGSRPAGAAPGPTRALPFPGARYRPLDPLGALLRAGRPLAAAALVVVAALVLVRLAPDTVGPTAADRLLAADAVQEARSAERAHARAVARLELRASPILARAGDPETSARYASLLMAHRDRLAFLDETIAEIAAFVDDNPGHAGARAMLLAAYTEKTDVLRQVIELERELSS